MGYLVGQAIRLRVFESKIALDQGQSSTLLHSPTDYRFVSIYRMIRCGPCGRTRLPKPPRNESPDAFRLKSGSLRYSGIARLGQANRLPHQGSTKSAWSK